MSWFDSDNMCTSLLVCICSYEYSNYNNIDYLNSIYIKKTNLLVIMYNESKLYDI